MSSKSLQSLENLNHHFLPFANILSSQTLFVMEVELTYNVVLVSEVQHGDFTMPHITQFSPRLSVLTICRQALDIRHEERPNDWIGDR